MPRGQPTAGGVEYEGKRFSHDSIILSETNAHDTPPTVPSAGMSTYSSAMATRSHDPVDPAHPGAGDASGAIPAGRSDAGDSAPAPLDGATDSPPPGRGNGDDPYPDTAGGLLGSAWVGLVLGALVTVLLLIFIAQNTTSTDVRYLGWEFSLPLGVLLLMAAIAGALIMALFAGFRILQLRMRARKARKLATRAH